MVDPLGVRKASQTNSVVSLIRHRIHFGLHQITIVYMRKNSTCLLTVVRTDVIEQLLLRNRIGNNARLSPRLKGFNYDVLLRQSEVSKNARGGRDLNEGPAIHLGLGNLAHESKYWLFDYLTRIHDYQI